MLDKLDKVIENLQRIKDELSSIIESRLEDVNLPLAQLLSNTIGQISSLNSLLKKHEKDIIPKIIVLLRAMHEDQSLMNNLPETVQNLIYQTLINAVAISPINSESFISLQDDIDPATTIYLSTGHKFDLIELLEFNKTKDTLINPWTNLAFSLVDQAYVINSAIMLHKRGFESLALERFIRKYHSPARAGCHNNAVYLFDAQENPYAIFTIDYSKCEISQHRLMLMQKSPRISSVLYNDRISLLEAASMPLENLQMLDRYRKLSTLLQSEQACTSFKKALLCSSKSEVFEMINSPTLKV